MNESDKDALIRAMDYCEHAPAPALSGLVKAFWMLGGDGEARSWVEHRAVPDGCVELIRRLHGRSRWDGDQPEIFAVGISDSSASFAISGDSRFAAIRFWPWAWPFLSGVSLNAMWGRWTAVTENPLRGLARRLPDAEAAETALLPLLAGAGRSRAVGQAVLESSSVDEIRRRTGLDARALQRWFARNVGMSPSRYLRVLRFHKAFEQVPGEPSLAGHAAAHGFADQAHMAREFKAHAGAPAGEARRKATGPFLR